MECLDSFLRVQHFRQLHKCESAGGSSVKIPNYLHYLNFETVRLDPGLEFMFCSLLGKVTDIQPCHVLAPLALLSWQLRFQLHGNMNL